MLMVRVEGNAEDRARAPLERHFRTGIVPHGRRAASGQHEDHLLVQLPLRCELAAGGNLADIAIVGGTRSVVVHKHGAAAPSRPRLQLDRVEIRNVEALNDIEAFGSHPARIGRVFFCREFLCQLLRNDCVFLHLSPPVAVWIRLAGEHPESPTLEVKSSLGGKQSSVNGPMFHIEEHGQLPHHLRPARARAASTSAKLGGAAHIKKR